MAKTHLETMFDYRGCTCVVMLQPLGYRCGYVGVQRGNVYWGRRTIDLGDINCHGGVTYANDHLPPDKPDGLWWIGFDCMHYRDAPDLAAVRIIYGEELVERANRYMIHGPDDRFIIRTMEYCANECKRIVDQLMGGIEDD